MKVTDIKGKPYIEVNERIKYFRKNHTGQIITSMVSLENGVCIFKAEVIVDGAIVATGHAYEKEGSSFINKTSYIENCETSAIGRALGIFGIGIDTSIASAEEVQNAIENQKPKTFKQLMYDLDAIMKKFKMDDFAKTEITSFYCNGAKIQELETPEQVTDFINKFDLVYSSYLNTK